MHHFGAIFVRVDGRMSPEYRNEPTLGLFLCSGPVVGPNIENALKGGIFNVQGSDWDAEHPGHIQTDVPRVFKRRGMT